MTLSADFQSRYGVAATTGEASRLRRAAGKFWQAVALRGPGWLQPADGEPIRRTMTELFDGAYAAWQVAMILDMAPGTIDFRVKASVAYWLHDDLREVCNA